MPKDFVYETRVIDSLLKSGWNDRTPIAWPNLRAEEDPSEGKVPWIKRQSLSGTPQHININGAEGGYRTNNILVIQVFVLIGTGEIELRTLASAAANIFRGQIVDGVQFFVPQVVIVGPDGTGWYQANVNIPFKWDFTNAEATS